MGSFTPDSNWNRVSYRGPYVNAAGSGNGVQLGSLYLPDSTRFRKPTAGWPLLISPNLAGFKVTFCQAALGPTQAVAGLLDMFRVMCLDNGMAVWVFAVTPTYDSGGTITGNSLTDSNPIGLDYFDNLHYGTAPLGRGIFIPLEIQKPSDYVGGTAGLHPMAEPLRDTSWRDTCMSIQYCYHNAARMGVDRDWFFGHGSSASADVVAYSACGPLAGRGPGFFPGGTGQDAQPTRVFKALSLHNFQPWMNMVNALTDPDFASQIVTFPKTVASGGSTSYNQPSAVSGYNDRSHYREASLRWYGTRSAEVLAANRALRVYMTMGDADTYNSAAGPWTLPADLDGPGHAKNPHDSFGASMLIDSTAFPDWTFKMSTLQANGQNDGVIDTTVGGTAAAETYNGLICKAMMDDFKATGFPSRHIYDGRLHR